MLFTTYAQAQEDQREDRNRNLASPVSTLPKEPSADHDNDWQEREDAEQLVGLRPYCRPARTRHSRHRPLEPYRSTKCTASSHSERGHTNCETHIIIHSDGADL